MVGDELLPGVAALGDDVALSLEDPIRERVSRKNRQMLFAGFGSGERLIVIPRCSSVGMFQSTPVHGGDGLDSKGLS